ncbi:MAG: hypothetical protein M1817_003255 [Caeruleum heppii]|nr:MAG: hypothetical protein M1817_003255 [Caeruleum heppii]
MADDGIGSLRDPLSDELKKEIVACFWRQRTQDVHLPDFISFFHYYDRTCKALYLGVLEKEADVTAASTHHHVMSIVSCLWDYLDEETEKDLPCRRPTVRESLESHTFGEGVSHDHINRSIDLALRLWLTINIRDPKFAPASNSRQWDDESSLRSFIASRFPTPQTSEVPSTLQRNVRLESNLTAVNLRRLSGIRTEWTQRLDEHLDFDHANRTVKVYMLKACLHHHRIRNVIEQAVIDETLLSLELLFPDWDAPTRQYLKEFEHFRNQPSVEYPHGLYLADFHHWRDRLSYLYLQFHAPAPSFRQVWNDRRNPVQWYTFWFAVAIFVMTIVFGIITSITAIMQTRYAYESMILARRAAASP